MIFIVTSILLKHHSIVSFSFSTIFPSIVLVDSVPHFCIGIFICGCLLV